MMKYDADWLNDICSKVDLLEYASNEFDFRRVGYDSYAAKCSKHADDNASLFITPSKNKWYCHGCRRGGNIINWIMVYEGLDFRQTVEKIAKLTGEEAPVYQTSSSMSVYRAASRIMNKSHEPIKRATFDESYMDKFEIPPDGEPHEWIEEGITQDAMKRFGVRIDVASNRIVYPVYDNNGDLIGAKGRTRYKNFKALGISKYMNYEKIGTVDYFQGMKENRDYIINKNEVIVVEGLKSVMKLYGWGFTNCVAAETSRINDEQIKELLRLRVKDIVIGFDNDVTLKEIESTAKHLSPFTNVYIIYDKKHLLGDPSDKVSPCDKGEAVWRQLYEGRMRYGR